MKICKLLHKNDSKQQLSLSQYFKKVVSSSKVQESGDDFESTNNGDFAIVCSTHSSETEPKEEAFESTNGKVLECAKTLNNSEVSANLKAPQCHKSVLDFSRDARNQRAIEAAGSDLNQSLITDYNFVVDEVELLTRENKILHGLGTTISQHLKQVSSSFPTCFPSVLQHLLTNASKNADKAPNGRRHLEVVKKFALSLFIYTGPLAYNFLQQNISLALSSLRTVQTQVFSEFNVISEGEFRFDKLLEHINRHQLSGIVTIGEDATRIISRVEYDNQTDRCVGFVLPIDENGLLIINSFVATSYCMSK